MRYFKKELLVSHPLYLPTGGRVPFEHVGGDNGILATEDERICVELDKVISQRRAGVREIRKEEYEDLKKKVGAPWPQSILPEMLLPSFRHPGTQPQQRRNVVAVADNGPIMAPNVPNDAPPPLVARRKLPRVRSARELMAAEQEPA